MLCFILYAQSSEINSHTHVVNQVFLVCKLKCYIIITRLFFSRPQNKVYTSKQSNLAYITLKCVSLFYFYKRNVYIYIVYININKIYLKKYK